MIRKGAIVAKYEALPQHMAEENKAALISNQSESRRKFDRTAR
jgi:hypothetical protein